MLVKNPIEFFNKVFFNHTLLKNYIRIIYIKGEQAVEKYIEEDELLYKYERLMVPTKILLDYIKENQ